MHLVNDFAVQPVEQLVVQLVVVLEFAALVEVEVLLLGYLRSGVCRHVLANLLLDSDALSCLSG